MAGQPRPHPYFHRSIETLLSLGFASGLFLDGLEERSFPEGHGPRPESSPVSWSGRLHEIPPVLVARM